jgi:hypothetical protein
MVPNVLMPKRAKKKLSKREIEETIMWLLTHKQKDVRAVLRKFRKLAPQKQALLDKKLLYLVSILDLAVKNGKRGARCKSCGLPMHVKWFGCPNPVVDVASVRPAKGVKASARVAKKSEKRR